MSKKCVYCGKEIASECVIDFCDSCGVASFGSKMFRTIVENMKSAQARGDLDQGAVE